MVVVVVVLAAVASPLVLSYLSRRHASCYTPATAATTAPPSLGIIYPVCFLCGAATRDAPPPGKFRLVAPLTTPSTAEVSSRAVPSLLSARYFRRVARAPRPRWTPRVARYAIPRAATLLAYFSVRRPDTTPRARILSSDAFHENRPTRSSIARRAGFRVCTPAPF